MKCKITNCLRSIHARELCEMHYRRLKRNGDTGPEGMLRKQRRFPVANSEKRFFDSIKKIGDCWIWKKGKTPRGYGEFQDEGRTNYAHRWSYAHFIGEIPKGLHVDHLCAKTSCVNPKHLEPVTRRENTLRQWERIRSKSV